MKTLVYRHPLLEKLTYGLGALVILALAPATAWLWPAEFVWTKILLSGGCAVLGLILFRSFWLALEWVWPGKTGLLAGHLFWRRFIPYKRITGLRQDPAVGLLYLTVGNKTLRIHRWLSHFDVFFHDLTVLFPHLTEPAPAATPRFSVTKTVIVLQLFFLAVVVLFAVLMLNFISSERHPVLFGLVVLVTGSLLGFLVFRLLFLFPMGYEVHPEYLQIRFLLRKKRLEARAVQRFVEDTYAAAGSTFYLIKLVFPGRSVVLDENFLKQSLRPWRAFILQHFHPGERQD